MYGHRRNVTRARPLASRGTIWTSLLAVFLIGQIAGSTSVTADPTELCPDTPHRFESLVVFAPGLARSKRILVYLPPGYDCAESRRYPVFYFNDGQDLFDWNPFAADLEPSVAAEIARREAWYGSWRLERQLDRAIAEGGLPPMIVVGIASDDGMRSRDLAPLPWGGSVDGLGVRYGRFIAQTVVPAVDRRYRSVADRRCRGIGGASLGGISALQIGLAHSESFGLVLAFSPVLRDPAIADYLAEAWPLADPPGPSAFLIDFDDDPIGTADREWLASVIAADKDSERRAVLLQTPAGRHAIGSWAERVVSALKRLVGGQCFE